MQKNRQVQSDVGEDAREERYRRFLENLTPVPATEIERWYRAIGLSEAESNRFNEIVLANTRLRSRDEELKQM